jgi:hypothetical protein
MIKEGTRVVVDHRYGYLRGEVVASGPGILEILLDCGGLLSSENEQIFFVCEKLDDNDINPILSPPVERLR